MGNFKDTVYSILLNEDKAALDRYKASKAAEAKASKTPKSKTPKSKASTLTIVPTETDTSKVVTKKKRSPIEPDNNDPRNQSQRIIPDQPARPEGPYHEVDVQTGVWNPGTEDETNQAGKAAIPAHNDPSSGSAPGSRQGESKDETTLHNSPAWQKMWSQSKQAVGQDPKTKVNMTTSKEIQDNGNDAIQNARDDSGSKLSGAEEEAKDARLPSEGATTQNHRDKGDAIEKVEKEKAKLRRQANERYSYNKALTFFAEQLNLKYIEEEVVNPENQPMTKSEISHRNKIRHKSPAKDARIVKSADKTKENAAYRLATYITMRGRKAKKKENK